MKILRGCTICVQFIFYTECFRTRTKFQTILGRDIEALKITQFKYYDYLAHPIL